MQNPQMAAMAGMNAAGGPVGGTPLMNNPQAETTRTNLNTYIYDYFIRNNHRELAKAMLDAELKVEVTNSKTQGMNGMDGMDDSKDKLPSPKLPTNQTVENSFLLDWWGQFWDVFVAARGKSPKSVAMQYVMQSRSISQYNANERNARLMMANNNMQYQRMMGNNMNGVAAKDLRTAAAMNNRNPNNQNQMANMNPMNKQAMMSAQMQRDGSGMEMNGQRAPSPGSNDNAPSPNKRPRVEGAMGSGNMPGNQFGEFGQTPNMANKQLEGLNPGVQGSPMNAPGLDGQNDAFAGNPRMGPQGAGQPPQGNHALQDYQMQLMLLEQQNKKRLLMARQEQDNMSQGPGPHGQPAAGGPAGFGQAMSPQGSRAGPSPNPTDQIKRGTPKMNQQGLPGSPMPDAAMQQNRNSPIPANFDPNQMPPGVPPQFYPTGVPMPGGNPAMMRPPSSHPGQFNGQPFNPQAQMEAMQRANGAMPNGAWRQGQQPGMMQPGQQPGPMGNPQGRNPMPPPPAPAGEQPGRTQEPSPSQPAAAAPPTPNQSNKPNPQKKATKDNKKKPAKKNAATTGATPASDADPPPTPTPSTPITPMHPSSFNKNGQAQPQPPQQAPQPQPQPPQVQAAPMDSTGGFPNISDDNNFDLNFPLEGPDVLDNFDFDSFLHNEDNGAFGGLSGDFNFGPDGVEATGDL